LYVLGYIGGGCFTHTRIGGARKCPDGHLASLGRMRLRTCPRICAKISVGLKGGKCAPPLAMELALNGLAFLTYFGAFLGVLGRSLRQAIEVCYVVFGYITNRAGNKAQLLRIY